MNMIIRLSRSLYIITRTGDLETCDSFMFANKHLFVAHKMNQLYYFSIVVIIDCGLTQLLSQLRRAQLFSGLVRINISLYCPRLHAG